MSIIERLGIAPSSMVLDIGFRNADELILISNLVGEHGLVYGIEPDESVVARANVQVRQVNNVRPMVGDAHKVPLEGGSVDVVIFKGVLHEVDSPLKALAEARRVCRSNGRIFIVDFSAFPWRWNFWSNLRWRLRHPEKLLAPALDKHPGFSAETIRDLIVRSNLVFERFETDFATGHHAGHAVPMFLASARK
jgi:ubiquinone/menaquinone biosynthesis C-methylase UbiE